MLVPADSEWVNAWVALHGGGKASGAFTTLAWALPERGLVGGLVFHDYNRVSCMVNVAFTEGWNPIGLLKAGLRYAFGQLGLRRLTFAISHANIRSIKIATGIGAFHEATLRDAIPEGDLHMYALFPGDCKLWSRLNGQKHRLSGRSELRGADPAAGAVEPQAVQHDVGRHAGESEFAPWHTNVDQDALV